MIRASILRGAAMRHRRGAGVPVFLTFQPMVDGECGRLVLRCRQIVYRERDHLPGWVNLLSILRTGKFELPVL
jgi:hypothetical protein